jgi:hypothetical protein
VSPEKRNPTKYDVDEHQHVAQEPVVHWLAGGHLAESAKRSMSAEGSVSERSQDG